MVAITDAARDVVARALDAGWTGPPFDPLQLADILRIPVVATESVRDARTVASGPKRVRIEFNPNRPRGRMRYSLAHEIAHTLFPDCAEMVRNRVEHTDVSADDWQLEALCNIAAAEFLMPAGMVDDLAVAPGDIHYLLRQQQRFDVSTEALFIRVVRLTDKPVAMFCASRVERGKALGRYRIDYDIAAPAWTLGAWRGTVVPRDSAVAHCTGIGFTAKGDERWGDGAPMHVECVGIPPYPGAAAPRVVGVLVPTGAVSASAPLLSYVRGDATRPRGDGPNLIVHVVNDKTSNWGGAGFARALRAAFPGVQDAFRQWVDAHPRAFRLGAVHVAVVDDDTRVASMVAQHGYGESDVPRIRYGALRAALAEVASIATQHAARIHMPRIGCGEAGGDWTVVEELVRAAFRPTGCRVTVYDLPDRPFEPRREIQRQLDL